MRRFLFLIGLAAMAANGQGGDVSGKKLIEFGWDEPDTGFLRAHLSEMQKTPFDGCVFHADFKAPGPKGGKGSFIGADWGKRLFTRAELEDAFDDARFIRSHLGRFKYNFLRFDVTPGTMDWFDDFSGVTGNARLAGELARAARAAGILFDIEQYEGPLFNYRKQRDAGKKSWELYAAQARRRGREVMQAFQDGDPGLTVFLTFGYSLPWAESEGRKSLADCSYGLLAPFLDGMVEAAGRREQIIDGFEISYGFKTADQFSDGRKTMTSGVLPIVRDPEKYARVFGRSFGIWMDYDWRKKGWDPGNPATNYFTPEAFEASARAALGQADKFVWIYTEKPWWWTSGGGSTNLPEAYKAALRAARAP